MKRLISVALAIALILSLTSCQKSGDPYLLLDEFAKAYGAEGVIYSPKISEGQPGYIPPGLIERIYRFSGEFPEDYAILLNSKPGYGGECGVFLCEGADMMSSMEEVCLERMRLLDSKGEHSFLRVKGNLIFYSTLSNKELAEGLWKEIIR